MLIEATFASPQVFGGSMGDEASAAATVLSTDNLRWSSIATSSTVQPPPRLSHAAVALREKVRRASNTACMPLVVHQAGMVVNTCTPSLVMIQIIASNPCSGCCAGVCIWWHDD